MKTLLCTLALATATLSPLAPAFADESATAQANTKTVTFNVDGVVCSECTGKIEAAVKKLPGVTLVTADVDKKNVTVTFDPSKTRVPAIKAAIAKAGFRSKLAV